MSGSSNGQNFLALILMCSPYLRDKLAPTKAKTPWYSKKKPRPLLRLRLCSRNIQSRFNYVFEIGEKVVFCVYNITCNGNFLFPFFFIGVVNKRMSTNQNVKSMEVIF